MSETNPDGSPLPPRVKPVLAPPSVKTAAPKKETLRITLPPRRASQQLNVALPTARAPIVDDAPKPLPQLIKPPVTSPAPSILPPAPATMSTPTPPSPQGTPPSSLPKPLPGQLPVLAPPPGGIRPPSISAGGAAPAPGALPVIRPPGAIGAPPSINPSAPAPGGLPSIRPPGAPGGLPAAPAPMAALPAARPASTDGSASSIPAPAKETIQIRNLKGGSNARPSQSRQPSVPPSTAIPSPIPAPANPTPAIIPPPQAGGVPGGIKPAGGARPASSATTKAAAPVTAPTRPAPVTPSYQPVAEEEGSSGLVNGLAIVAALLSWATAIYLGMNL
ncbi:MAG: hypothetical protein ACAI35_22015 [Candidatus Methylacidiphilales bacterium]|nr:hypothetical protein [Candidatus Methylacidiphilales bacterium]